MMTQNGISDVFRSQIASQETQDNLSGNKRNNDDRGWTRVADPINPMTYVNGLKLFFGGSPHSNYDCSKNPNVFCGDRK